MDQRAEKLAEEHWQYVSALLEAHGVSLDILSIVGFHYRTAFSHGWKHGNEDASRSWGEVIAEPPPTGTF